MLTVQAGLHVNAVVWIMSLEDDDERQSTAQVFAFLADGETLQLTPSEPPTAI